MACKNGSAGLQNSYVALGASNYVINSKITFISILNTTSNYKKIGSIIWGLNCWKSFILLRQVKRSGCVFSEKMNDSLSLSC